MGSVKKIYYLDIYRFIVNYMIENGFSPAIKEISEEFSISTSTANLYLDDLQGRGFIECIPKTSRAIKLVGYKLVKE